MRLSGPLPGCVVRLPGAGGAGARTKRGTQAGLGQAAIGLARHFKLVVATDASSSQIDHARTIRESSTASSGRVL